MKRETRKINIHLDGMAGWAKRASARARAIDEGRDFPPSRAITFESAADLVRLLTPARLDIFEAIKGRSFTLKELATALGRDPSAVRRDVVALERFGLVSSSQAINPGHGRVRVVTAPASVSVSARI